MPISPTISLNGNNLLYPVDINLKTKNNQSKSAFKCLQSFIYSFNSFFFLFAVIALVMIFIKSTVSDGNKLDIKIDLFYWMGIVKLNGWNFAMSLKWLISLKWQWFHRICANLSRFNLENWIFKMV